MRLRLFGYLLVVALLLGLVTPDAAAASPLPGATTAGYSTLATVLLLVISAAAPYVSAFLTRAPTGLTGAITALISALTGFLTQWAQGGDSFDVKGALFASLLSWAVALGVKNGVLKRTDTEASLHAHGPQLGRPASTTPVGHDVLAP